MRAKRSTGSSFGLAAVVLAAGLFFTSCTQNASSITCSRYALVYGIKTYPGTLNNLNYTVNDANSMATTLSNQGWTVTEKTDSDATYENISAGIGGLSAISSDSTVLLYYSGHGTYNGNTVYILPYNSIVASNVGSSYETASLDYSKTISPSTLSTLLASLPTKNVIIIFDSCYSGGFVDSGSAIDASPSSYASYQGQSYSAFSTALANFGSLLASNAQASDAKTPIVLSAAGSQEESVETSAIGHGVFTYYLLQSATKGDSNGDGYVTMTEAYAYTAKYVTVWDANEGSSAFLPHLSGGTRDLVLFTD